jgi:hypothetical protein
MIPRTSGGRPRRLVGTPNHPRRNKLALDRAAELIFALLRFLLGDGSSFTARSSDLLPTLFFSHLWSEPVLSLPPWSPSLSVSLASSLASISPCNELLIRFDIVVGLDQSLPCLASSPPRTEVPSPRSSSSPGPSLARSLATSRLACTLVWTAKTLRS